MPYKTKELRRAHYDRNKVQLRAKCKKWREDNRDKKNLYQKEYYSTHKNVYSNSRIKKAYGIDLAQMEAMFVSQGGRCGICKREFEKRKDVHIDHNHSTGNVRSLLCYQCNLMLGFSREDVLVLESAITYLNKWNLLKETL
jgi:hypothetical protein